MIAKSEHPEHSAQSQQNRHECDQATASSTIHRALLQGGGRVFGRSPSASQSEGGSLRTQWRSPYSKVSRS